MVSETPDEFNNNVIEIEQNQKISRNKLLNQLVTSLYSRSDIQFERGNFKVQGDTVSVFPAYADIAYKIHFWGDEIEEIESFEPCKQHYFRKVRILTHFSSNYFCGF